MRNKLDKIFDNKYEEHEVDNSQMNFTIVSDYGANLDPEGDVHASLLFDEINEIITTSKFDKYNTLKDNGSAVKLNKIQINEVYTYVISKVSRGYRRIEIWATLAEYFDIYTNKFYTSLSNKYKNELIEELDKVYQILGSSKGIKKMF
jgi:hypothetical protein